MLPDSEQVHFIHSVCGALTQNKFSYESHEPLFSNFAIMLLKMYQDFNLSVNSLNTANSTKAFGERFGQGLGMGSDKGSGKDSDKDSGKGLGKFL